MRSAPQRHRTDIRLQALSYDSFGFFFRHLNEFFRDLVDGEGQLLGGRGLRDPGDHDLVQPEQIGIENEVLVQGPGGEVDRTGLRTEAEVRGRQAHALAEMGGGDIERITPVKVRRGPEDQGLDDDVGPDEWRKKKPNES